MQRLENLSLAIDQQRLDAFYSGTPWERPERLQNGIDATNKAISGTGLPYGDNWIKMARVARDADGNIVGAVSYAINYDERSPYQVVKVGVLGSTQEMPGVGSALQYSLLSAASSANDGNGAKVDSEIGYSSQDFHIAIGRTVAEYDKESHSQSSSWSPEDAVSMFSKVKQIVNGVIKMAKDVPYDPDAVSPFWDTPEGQEIWTNEPVQKYSPDQPRDSHGRFGSNDEANSSERYPAHIEFIARQLKIFLAAGGTVGICTSPIEVRDTRDESQRIRKSLSEQLRSITDESFPSTDEERNGLSKEYQQIGRLTSGATMLTSACDQAINYPGSTDLLVARDSTGKIVAGISVIGEKNILQTEQIVSVGYLGSYQRVPGAATALQYALTLLVEQASSALGEKLSLYSSCTSDSRAYHELIGRQVNFIDSKWKPNQISEIASSVEKILGSQIHNSISVAYSRVIENAREVTPITKSLSPDEASEYDPDAVSPFWSTPEGEAIWRGKTLQKYSPGQPRDAHGRFGSNAYEKEIEQYSPHIQFIANHVKSFLAAGGTVSFIDGAERNDAIEKGKALHEEVKGKRNFALESGVRMAVWALDGRDECLVAKDSEGNVVAAIGLAPSEFSFEEGKEGITEIEISYLGSYQRVPGAATALQYAVACLARNEGASINSEYTVESRAYHDKIGRELGERGWSSSSSWSNKDATEIANSVEQILGSQIRNSVDLTSSVFSRAQKFSLASLLKYSEDQPRDYHGRFASENSSEEQATKPGREIQPGDTITWGRHGVVTVDSIVVHPRSSTYYVVRGTKPDGTKVKFDVSASKAYPVVSPSGSTKPVEAVKPETNKPTVVVTEKEMEELKSARPDLAQKVNDMLTSRLPDAKFSALDIAKEYGAKIDAKIQEVYQRELAKAGLGDFTDERIKALTYELLGEKREEDRQNDDERSEAFNNVIQEYTRNFNNGVVSAFANALEKIGAGEYKSTMINGNYEPDTTGTILQSDIDAFKNGLVDNAGNYIGLLFRPSSLPFRFRDGEDFYLNNGAGGTATASIAMQSVSNFGLEQLVGGGSKYYYDGRMQTLTLPSGAQVHAYDLYQANKKEFASLGIKYSSSERSGFRFPNGTEVKAMVKEGDTSKLGKNLISQETMQTYRDASQSKAQQKIDELNQKVDQVRQIKIDSIFAVLSGIRPYGLASGEEINLKEVKGTKTLTNLGKQLLSTAQKYYPSQWLERSQQNGFTLKVSNTRGSAHYEIYSSTMYIPTKSFGGTTFNRDNISVVTHELFHRMEALNWRVGQIEEAFWKTRVPSQKIETLREYGKVPGNKDNFARSYCGRIYSRSLTGSHWEVGSSGIQGLVGETGYEVNKDPDYRAFLLGMLSLVDAKT